MQQPLPAWLTTEEAYAPPAGKDAFIERSILSLLGVLSRMRAQSVRRGGKFAAHAVFRLAFTLTLIVLLSLAQSPSFVMIVLVGMLCRIAMLNGEEIARVLRCGLGAALFTAIVLLPAGLLGNWRSMAALTPKVFVSVSALSLLSAGTRWNGLTGALKYFLIPDLFIFVLDIALKYIYLLGELTLNMLYALKLRSVGKSGGGQSSLSGVAGTLFLRSREMAGELHAAMECRGFTGKYQRPARFLFGLADAALIVLGLGLVLLYIYLK